MHVKVAIALAGTLAAAAGTEAGVRVVARRPHTVVVARHRVMAPRPVIVRTPLLRVTVGGAVAERTGYGRLHVEAQPERAQVFIDGRYEGRGDMTRTLRAGKHTVRVVLGDGREAAQTVDIDAGRLTAVKLEL